MHGILTVVHTLSDSLLGDMKEGDTPIDVTFPQMTLILAKRNTDILSNMSFLTKQGSLTLPNINQQRIITKDKIDIRTPTCSEVQVTFRTCKKLDRSQEDQLYYNY